MKPITEISRRIGGYRPNLLPPGNGYTAAVAAILCERKGQVELLFIERAKKTGDPWSGHIAFPGGRTEQEDADVAETARRETREELGIDLNKATPLGRLDDVAAHIGPMNVSVFVYFMEACDEFVYSDEVDQAFWFPLQKLADSDRHTTFSVPGDCRNSNMPAIVLLGPGETVLWGLTYRFVEQLVRLAGVSFPRSVSK
ncbi:MAG: CoA pyrophosphatase, partial [Candidatus Latescibacteria bacterium]|nr:CoA pyrophosphatase [Candidatus Latescibacterota bacterium]